MAVNNTLTCVFLLFSEMLPQGAWYQVIDILYGNFRKFRLNREKSNTLENIIFFPKIIEPYHLNSYQNKRFFQASGKRSNFNKILQLESP